jgi:hypothetical protein
MYLRKEQVKKPFCGFEPLGSDHPLYPFPMQIEQPWLLRLIEYMKRHGFKLGYDFFFEMGYDAPTRQYNAAIPGRSVMIWKEKDEDGVMQHARVNVIDCLIQLMQDEKKGATLEQWDDVG